MKTSLKIEPSMNLQSLAERMGGATEAEAYAMAELLMWDWFGKYCDDVPDATWLRMIDESVLTTQA
jgi:hypothetical protein